MNVSLEGLTHKAKRLFAAFFSWLLNRLRYVTKHPIKSIIFAVKAYLLLMLFAFFLVFSVGSFAEEPAYTCPDGGQLTDYYGQQICKVGVQSGAQTTCVMDVNGQVFRGTHVNPDQACHLACGARVAWLAGISQSRYSCTSGPSYNFEEYYYETTWDGKIVDKWKPAVSRGFPHSTYLTEDEFCPPDTYPTHSSMGTLPDDTKICYKPAVPEEPEPCDCSDLNGEGSFTNQSFIAENGAYSQENPPGCLNIRDDVDPSAPSCNCQIVASKWFAQTVNVNGVEKTRWQPLPTPAENGQSGVFTGAACGDEEDTEPPPEKEKCVDFKNGTKMCLADKSEKCIVLDGVQQCQTGCGTVNGEFFCAESEGDPDEDLPDPDDNITDPDKPHDDMKKSDFKEVNKGIETRLDLLAKLMEQNNSKVSSGGAANSAKVDTSNRLLGEINSKLGELVAQGEEDGEGGEETNPQPDYSTDALQDFVNPNDWEQRNFGTVMQASVERMQQAPVFTAVESFFTVSITGTCPTWQASLSMPFGGTFEINIDQLCSPAMEQIWPAIRAIVILMFSVMAFRVAIL